MRKLLGLVVLLALLFTVTSTTTSPPDAMHTMEGTWELQSFYSYDGQNVSDTVPVSEGYRQVKMYYDGKVMWARIDPRAPIGRFGYGTYQITDTELIETIEFGDAEFMKALDTMRIFTFDLILGDNTYSQVSVDENGLPFFAENYLRVK